MIVSGCLSERLYQIMSMRRNGRRGSGYCPVCGFVGGWILRRRKSAKTAEKNPELAPTSLKQLDFFQQRRFPPSKKRTPPAEAEPDSILSLGCAFRPERRKNPVGNKQ